MAAALDVLADALEVGDGLLEDVAEDVHIDDRADFLGLVRIGDGAGGAEIVVGEIAEVAADFVRDVQGVESLIMGEEAAVVGGIFSPALPLSTERKRPRKFSQTGRGL